jgi:hypothetical protein
VRLKGKFSKSLKKEQILFMLQSGDQNIWILVQDGVSQTDLGHDSLDITSVLHSYENCPFDVTKSLKSPSDGYQEDSVTKKIECANQGRVFFSINIFLYKQTKF